MNVDSILNFTSYAIIFAGFLFGIGTVVRNAGRIRSRYPDETWLTAVIDAAAYTIERWFNLTAGCAGLLSFALAFQLNASPPCALASAVVAIAIVNVLRNPKNPDVS